MRDGPINVLLVEDSPTDALLLREALAGEDSVQFRTAHVERLAEALKYLQEQQFDLILLDLGLPDSQGLDTFSRVHDHAPQVPIVVLTGLDDDTLALRAVQEGAQVAIPIEATRPRARLRPEVLAGLQGQPLGDGLHGHWVQAYYVHLFVGDAGGRVFADVQEERVVFAATLPA